MHAFASVFDGARIAEIVFREGWANDARIELTSSSQEAVAACALR